jgi:hypothetical protein
MAMVKKLKTEHPEPPKAKSHDAISLEDTVAQKLRGVAKRTRNPQSGYNPYDMVPKTPSAKEAPKTKTDLRKLSEWIRLSRQVAALKKDRDKPE